LVFLGATFRAAFFTFFLAIALWILWMDGSKFFLLENNAATIYIRVDRTRLLEQKISTVSPVSVVGLIPMGPLYSRINLVS
jgi:hypothetical protein